MRKIICQHRFHGTQPLSAAHSYQKEIGMSISISDFEQRIMEIPPVERSSLVLTIDDGHKDAFRLISMTERHGLNPIIFMTARQIKGEVKTLPLTALYAWCWQTNKDPNKIKEELGFDRLSLKMLRQDEQERLLVKAGIPLDPVEERMLDHDDLTRLISKGFQIGYHGPEHCDLRIIPHSELRNSFDRDFELYKKEGYVSEIAWPEGWWNDAISDIAFQSGFKKQYGLSSSRVVNHEQVIWPRNIWK